MVGRTMRGDIPYDKPWIRSKSLMWEHKSLKDIICQDNVLAAILSTIFLLCVTLVLLFAP